MENKDHIKQLIHKYVLNECSPAEQDELIALLDTAAGHTAMEDYLNADADEAFEQPATLDPEVSQRIFRQLEQHIEAQKEQRGVRVLQLRWWRMAAAIAGICLVIGIGYRFYHQPENRKYVTAAGQLQTVILPDEVDTSKVPVIENAYWHRGQLVFEDEPINAITEELEKWYHIRIRLEEQPGDCRFNFHVGGEPLPEVLKMLEEITGATSEFDGKTVTIKGKLCEGSQP